MHCEVVIWLVSVLAAASASVNYCGARMCGHTNFHTFCQFPEGPSPACEGYMKVPLSTEEKSRVISRLNRRRNEAASGYFGLPSAGNMLKLRWVEELAREAQRWADQCRPPNSPEEHDACRDLYSIQVGQCVASVVGEAPGLRVESMVDIWYMQNILYKGNVTFYMPPIGNTSYYGDFAQIMWARSYMLGCGRSRFMTNWNGRLRSVERLVCNIGPRGPPAARPLWAPAAPAASCPPRAVPDATFTSLCNFQQNHSDIISIDESMTLEEHLLLNTVLEIEENKTMDYFGSLDEVYLTRLAIATMEDTMSTQTYYNSMQRRDVVEIIQFEDNTNTSRVVVSSDMLKAPGLEDILTTKPTVATKKKISLIGRPKSYNIDELSNQIEDPIENDAPIMEVPKEFYAEYEFVEALEDNTTDVTELINRTDDVNSVVDYPLTLKSSVINRAPEVVYVVENIDKAKEQNYGIINQTDNLVFRRDVTREIAYQIASPNQQLYFVPQVAQNQQVTSTSMSYAVLSSANMNLYNTHIVAVDANGSYVVTDNVDDYLSDPETVRELQEALERIEHSIADTQTERQVKVRRELREYPSDMNPMNNQKLSVETYKNPAALPEMVPKTEPEEDRSTMYDMVMKFMPYLKQNEGLKGKSTTTKSDCIVNSILLVVLSFVII